MEQLMYRPAEAAHVLGIGVARMQLQARQRAAAARTAVEICRHWREWPAFAAAAVTSLPRRRGLRRWCREGERWLGPIRDLESAPASWGASGSQAASRRGDSGR